MRGKRYAVALALALAVGAGAPAQATTTDHYVRYSPGGSISAHATGTLGWAGDTVTVTCPSDTKVTGAGSSFDGQSPGFSTRLSEDGRSWTVQATDWQDGAAIVGVKSGATCFRNVKGGETADAWTGTSLTHTVTKAGDSFVVYCHEAHKVSGATITQFPETVNVRHSGQPTADGGWVVTVDSIGEASPVNLTVTGTCEPCP